MLLLRVLRAIPLFLLLSPFLLAHASEKNGMTTRFVCMQFGKVGLGVGGAKRTVKFPLTWEKGSSELLAI